MYVPVETHPKVDALVWFIRDSEHHRAGQQVQGHGGDLRHVVLTW